MSEPIITMTREPVIINDKRVDVGSIVLAGIDVGDYPDYSDAYVEYAEYEDGRGLTENECELLHNYYPDLIYNLVAEEACNRAEPYYLD